MATKMWAAKLGEGWEY
uniref:Ribosomal protein n=1 Tax=Rhizophora mucronata TaxID=61149 RepID=A0A2P2J5J4_RHIMU